MIYIVGLCTSIDVKDISEVEGVGWYSTIEKAKKCVEENKCNLSDDGFYKYAVIEGYAEGLYPFSVNPLWYRWNKDHFEPMEYPDNLSHISNFILG